jgi:hypothetical protein
LRFHSDTTLSFNLIPWFREKHHFMMTMSLRSANNDNHTMVTSSPSITCCWRPLLGKTLPDDSISRSARVCVPQHGQNTAETVKEGNHHSCQGLSTKRLFHSRAKQYENTSNFKEHVRTDIDLPWSTWATMAKFRVRCSGMEA